MTVVPLVPLQVSLVSFLMARHAQAAPRAQLMLSCWKTRLGVQVAFCAHGSSPQVVISLSSRDLASQPCLLLSTQSFLLTSQLAGVSLFVHMAARFCFSFQAVALLILSEPPCRRLNSISSQLSGSSTCHSRSSSLAMALHASTAAVSVFLQRQASTTLICVFHTRQQPFQLQRR